MRSQRGVLEGLIYCLFSEPFRNASRVGTTTVLALTLYFRLDNLRGSRNLTHVNGYTNVHQPTMADKRLDYVGRVRRPVHRGQ